MTNTNEWRMNDGTVPEGVGPDTVIEVEYFNGELWKWPVEALYWGLDGNPRGIARWRFV